MTKRMVFRPYSCFNNLGLNKLVFALGLSILFCLNGYSQRFGPQQVIHVANNGPKKVASADLDQDGDQDVLSLSFSNGRLAWYENDGKGNFQTRFVTRNISFGNDVDIADINQDGYLDIVLGTMNEVTWYENDGNQQFTTHTLAGVNNARVVRVADLDQDGNRDIIAAIEGNNEIIWYENQGSQNFKKHTLFSNISGFRDLAVVDMDRDQDLDLAYASYTNNTIAWLENTGSLSFSKQVISDSANGANSIVVKDINGDSNRDVASASINDNTIAWYENKGSGRFKAHAIDNQAKGATDIKVVDLNADGYKDLLGGNYDDDEIKVYLNDSNKGFTQDTVTTQVDGVMSVDAADLNGNNKKDVLSCSYNDFKVAWYENKRQTKNFDNPDSINENTALEFDGKDDYVNVGDIDEVEGTQYLSLSAWVKPRSLYKETIISKWDHKSHDVWGLRIDSPNEIRFYTANNLTDWGRYRIQTTNANLKRNEWTHIAVVFDGTKTNTKERIKIFKNGKLLKAVEAYGNPIPSSLISSDKAEVRIGSFGGNLPFNAHFNGLMDDVCIWKDAKTQEEIKNDICSPPNFTADSNLIAYWNFNDGIENIAKDVGNHDGTLEAGTQWVIDTFSRCNEKDDTLKYLCNNFAKRVISSHQGLTKNQKSIKSSRSDSSNVLESPNRKFFSLGFFDRTHITIGFDSFMTGRLTLYEESWNSTNYVEKAKVYVSEDQSNWQFIGTANNQNNPKGNIHPFTFHLDSLRYKYVKVVNATDSSEFGGNADGFDLNAICAEKTAPIQTLNPAPACQFYGHEIIDFKQGTYKNGQAISTPRSNSQNVLGTPSLPLYSLGFQNQMNQKPYFIIGFKELVTGKLSIYEYNNNPLETADIYVSTDTSNWIYIGEAHNYTKSGPNEYVTTFDLDTLSYQYVKVVNTTDKTLWGPKGDGFDLLGICSEEKVYSNQTLSQGCFSVQHIFTNNNGDGTVTKRFKVTNNCSKGWSNSAFQLKAGTQALSYASGGDYPAENTSNNPFHSIKFECDQSDCFNNGKSDWFEFTINNFDTLTNIQVQTKAGQKQEQITFGNVATNDDQNTGIEANSATNKILVYPNPVTKGQSITVKWNEEKERQFFQLLSLQGDIIKSYEVHSQSRSFKIDTEKLTEGIYLIKERKESFLKRIVVQ